MNNTFSIAFYNVENLFDTEHNEFTLDEDYTPEGQFQWNDNKYQRKIQNLGNVISKIGLKESSLPPIFIGLAEIENEACLLDLISDEKLKPFDYDFVHYDSPDERGIDVAFLYQKEHFKLSYSENYTLCLKNNFDQRDYTRDILLVTGKLFHKQVYIIVNHWPSRNGGTSSTNYKRVQAAQLIHQIIDDIHKDVDDPSIIIMGDFNDEPRSSSIRNYLMNKDLYNPMLKYQDAKKGSVNYHGKWFMFDQIILNKVLLNNDNLKFISAEIFDEFFLQEPKGKRKGAPKRTYIGKWHMGGFSDHFPVFAYFKNID